MAGNPILQPLLNFTTFANVTPNIEVEMKPERAPLLNHSIPIIVVLSVAYALVFILAIVNNILVVTVIVRNPAMRNVTNYFLANLAVADITVSIVVLPITLLNHIYTEWWFGAFLCKAVSYLQGVVVSASVYTLVAVSIERYFALFYPHKTIIRPQHACWIIAIIWIAPCCMQLPWALYQTQFFWPSEKYIQPIIICVPMFPSKMIQNGFVLGVIIGCYIVPLVFISVCYSFIGIKVARRNVGGIRGTRTERNIQRSKIRIIRMLIVVVAFFACSWLPMYCIHLRILFGPSMSWSEKKVVGVLKPIAQWLTSANSCVNPIIYCYFSEQFRKSFVALLSARSCRGKITI